MVYIWDMIDKVNNIIIKKYISSCGETNDFNRERIEYALKILLNEGEKIFGILVFFICMGLAKAFALSFVVLMSMRIFIGGIHFTTRLKCFSFTTLFFMIVIHMSEYFVLCKVVGVVVGCVAFVNIILFAPLKSKHRILVTEGRRIHLRKCALVALVIWLIFYSALEDNEANLIMWTVVMQQTELLYGAYLERRGTR